MAQAALDRLFALQTYSHITAPFAGVVTKRYVDTGALISAGTSSETQSQPVVQLAEWSLFGWRFRFPNPPCPCPFGHVVQVHVLDLNRDFQGRVARFADALNEETRTMHTEIDVENPQDTLTDGMYAEVKLGLQGKRMRSPFPFKPWSRKVPGQSARHFCRAPVYSSFRVGVLLAHECHGRVDQCHAVERLGAGFFPAD